MIDGQVDVSVLPSSFEENVIFRCKNFLMFFTRKLDDEK